MEALPPILEVSPDTMAIFRISVYNTKPLFEIQITSRHGEDLHTGTDQKPCTQIIAEATHRMNTLAP